LVIYNEALDEDVLSSLEKCGIPHFTKWQKVLGKGQISEPHLDTSVWPGVNNVCAAVVENKLVPVVLAKIKELRVSLGREGIKAFVLPVEDVV